MVLIIQNGEAEAGQIGSIEVSKAGINDEKYYKCEDFDEEAATVQLDAGLRAD